MDEGERQYRIRHIDRAWQLYQDCGEFNCLGSDVLDKAFELAELIEKRMEVDRG